MKRILAVIMAAMLVLGTGATSASATGSDGPTPYTVDRAGVTLPSGQTFKPHGHVNIKYLDKRGAEKSTGVHFDPNNNQPGGKWVGRNFIPWSAFSGDKVCITWVQVHGFNQHFGEGGQKPLCLSKPPTAPPTESEEREKITGYNCEERVVNYVKEKRDVIFDYDYRQAKWVGVGFTSWEVVSNSDFTKNMTEAELKKQCPELPEVGSSTGLGFLGLGVLVLVVGAVLLYRRNQKH